MKSLFFILLILIIVAIAAIAVLVIYLVKKRNESFTGSGGYSFNWDQPSDTGGDPNCCSYNWQVLDSTGATTQSGTIPNTTDSAIKTVPAAFNLGNFGENYTLSITATNAYGTSSPSTLNFYSGDGNPVLGSPITVTHSDGTPINITGDSLNDIVVNIPMTNITGNDPLVLNGSSWSISPDQIMELVNTAGSTVGNLVQKGSPTIQTGTPYIVSFPLQNSSGMSLTEGEYLKGISSVMLANSYGTSIVPAYLPQIGPATFPPGPPSSLQLTYNLSS